MLTRICNTNIEFLRFPLFFFTNDYRFSAPNSTYELHMPVFFFPLISRTLCRCRFFFFFFSSPIDSHVYVFYNDLINMRVYLMDSSFSPSSYDHTSFKFLLKLFIFPSLTPNPSFSPSYML